MELFIWINGQHIKKIEHDPRTKCVGHRLILRGMTLFLVCITNVSAVDTFEQSFFSGKSVFIKFIIIIILCFDFNFFSPDAYFSLDLTVA